jgi:hypothetical protein
MNGYKFKRSCCGELYDIRWERVCRKCQTNFMEKEEKVYKKEFDELTKRFGFFSK